MKNLIFFYALLISSLLVISCKKDFQFQERNTTKLIINSRELMTAVLPKVYYVSPAGNDNNDGTSTATPWQTLTKVNAQIFSHYMYGIATQKGHKLISSYLKKLNP